MTVTFRVRSRAIQKDNTYLRLSSPGWLLIALFWCSALIADDAPLADEITGALPSPLKLLQAMTIGTSEVHPDILVARARQAQAQAQILRAESAYALEADINLEAARIEPAPNAFDSSPNDNKASLNIRKPLYDFGYTSSRLEAAQTGVDAEQLEYRHALARQQIAISRSFFDAVLSDIKFAWDNEAMAMLYVRVDKIRDRYDLKQVSEVDLLKAETDYQQLLTTRRNTEILQRISRAQLAETINRPGELSADLAAPELDFNNLQLPDPEDLIKRALQTNFELRAQLKRVAATAAEMDAARKQSRPTLGAEIEVAEYSRELPSREDWRAAINLKIPLFENALVKSDIADKRALWLQQQAQLYQMQSDIRRQVYTSWMSLNGFITKASELEIAAQAAERALDKSRGEYELELRTDYGDTLVNTSRVRYEQARNRFDTIIAAMQLAMLIGEPPRSIIENGVVILDNRTTGEANAKPD
jgi:outer membrane protein TolC